MKPVFCAEVFTEVTTATFTLTDTDTATAYPFSWDVPAGLYYLGAMAYPAAPNVFDALIDQIATATSDTWEISPAPLSGNIGVSMSVIATGTVGNLGWTLSANNAAARHVLWSCGFRDTSLVTAASDEGVSDGIPYATWWPKAYNVIQERYNPVSVAAFTSPLPGSGSTVASVRMEPTTQSRHWRSWQVLPIDAARCSIQRATSQVDTTWATEAGLTTNPGDAALDNPDWWWSRVLDGSHRFAAIEDEAELVSGTPRYGIYRIVYDSDAPMNMEPFKGLRAPILSQWSPAGARQQLEFCAIRTAAGNL